MQQVFGYKCNLWGGCVRRVEMISSCGENVSSGLGGRGEKSGGVEGAGMSASLSSGEGNWRAWLMR